MVDSLYNRNMYLNNAANRNTWQWDLQTSMPNDILGALNDSSIWSYGANVGSLVNSTAALQAQLPTLIANFQAQMAQMWQNTMSQINSGNVTLNPVLNPVINNNNNNNNGERISEGKIIHYLQKMGSGKAVADRINQEITVDGKKTTILNRLIELVDGYRKDPENATLSESNFERVWNIVDKYAKNGDITSSEFAILKEIALNPKGKTEEVDETEDEEENDEPSLSSVEEEKKTNVTYKQTVNDTAEWFEKALYGLGTSHSSLQTAIEGCNADNIIEVYDKFGKSYGINEGETLIDAIYADFDDWTNSWYGLKGSASTFTAIKDLLVERAQNHINNYGDDKNKTLTKALDAFNKAFDDINEDNYDSKKEEISKMFKNIVAAIKTAEASKIATEKKENK